MTVLFALMLVAILAIFGVALEMGVVTITRDRMQSAAESAAKEILRERDFAITPAAETSEFVRDYERRERNSRFASWTFDLDEHGGGYDGPLNEEYQPTEEGAGPYQVVWGGTGETNFGQRFAKAPPQGPSFHSIPVPELNCGEDGTEELNERHGDIVTGAFTSGALGYGGNPIHLEQSEDYQRTDFTAAEAGVAPFADSVLVRLRRTFSPGAPGSFPMDRDPGISSSGWTMPLMFGAGSLFIGTDPGNGYSIRHHGLRMRATAIAQGRPAVRAGLAHPEYGPGWEIGVGTITLNARNWDPFDESSPAWWTESDGSRAIELKVREYHALRNDFDDAFLFGVMQPKLPRRVGDELEFLPYDDNLTNWWEQPGYEPEFWLVDEIYAPAFYAVYHPGGDGEPPGIRRYFTGFFRVRTEIYIDPITNEPVYDYTPEGVQIPIPHIKLIVMANEMSNDPEAPWMAPRNASAVFDGLQNQDLTPLIWSTLMVLLEDTPGLILAPALVR